MNFYKHYIGDYARDTQSLSLREHGAYRVLLDHCYATEKPLPIDRAEIYRIAKAMDAAERKAVDKIAERFFPDGHNARCDDEIANASAYADAQSMRAQKRWHKQAQSPGDASHSQTPDKEKKRGGRLRASRLPTDWVLPKAWGDWALAEQSTWTPEHVRKVAENFKDHWLGAPKGTKLDWLATWRKWVRGDPALKGANGAAKPWYLTASGIEAKGAEFSIEVPVDKQDWPAFKAKVYEAAGVTEKMVKQAQADFR